VCRIGIIGTLPSRPDVRETSLIKSYEESEGDVVLAKG
jgi:hypothetical protein